MVHYWLRKEVGLLCTNDSRRRLGKKKEAEGQMMERQADRSDCGGEKESRKMYGSGRGVSH